MTDEIGLLDKVNGWLVAGIAAAINLLLGTWIKMMGNKTASLTKRVQYLEESKADLDSFTAHARVNDAQHTAFFEKIDDLHTKIDKKMDDTRREIKGDIKMVADLIRGRGTGE